MTSIGKWKVAAAVAALLVVSSVVWLILRGNPNDALTARDELLSHLPSDATSVVYADLQELRASPFLNQILSLAPSPTADEDYKKFVEATGFQYERDLDRMAISFSGSTQNPKTMAVAEGRFDRKRIEAYSKQFGNLRTANGKTIYAIPLHSSRIAYFTFLRNDQAALCNDASCFFQEAAQGEASNEWHEHFLRLAGTPLFALFRQDSPLLSALAQQTPGGLSSPQLANLLAQLHWLSIGGKPEGQQLRVVVDGEAGNEGVTRQLNDMLSGLLILAQGGLDDPKTRKRLDPQVREAYLQLLRSAEVQKIDRGTSKSVRLIFEVSPALLKAAGTSNSADPPDKPSAKGK